MRMPRRQLLKTASPAAAAAVATPMLNRCRYVLFAGSPSEYSARAVEIMRRSLVIDMLSRWCRARRNS